MDLPFDPLTPETWYGGYYEAGMILGAHGDVSANARLKSAIVALWENPNLRIGAIGDVSRWQSDTGQNLQDRTIDELQRIYGSFSNALGIIPFTSITMREEKGDDWLYASVPLGGLQQSGGFPFEADSTASQSWRQPLEQALSVLVLDVFNSVGGVAAEIGFEVAGFIRTPPEALADDAERWVGYITKDECAYRYWPTNVWSGWGARRD